MIVLDTDIVTLLSYGRTDKLRSRIEQVESDEILGITIITRMEILQGRYASIIKSSDAEQLSVGVDRFRRSEDLLNGFHLLYPDETACGYFDGLRTTKSKKS
jgi:tRNA(fMet)-specific endonuclease VapC